MVSDDMREFFAVPRASLEALRPSWDAPPSCDARRASKDRRTSTDWRKTQPPCAAIRSLSFQRTFRAAG